MPTTWENVAVAVTERRKALGLTQGEASSRADISPTTWQKLESRAEPLSDRSLDRLAMALGWMPDFAERIGKGESPRLVVDELDAIEEAIRDKEEWVEAGDDHARADIRALQVQKALLAGRLGRHLQAGPSHDDPLAHAVKAAWPTLMGRRPPEAWDVVVETPDGTLLVAQVNSGDRFLDAIRLEMIEAVGRLSFNTLYAAMVAISWARYRDEAVAGLDRDDRLRMQAEAPPLDDLVWNPPSIEEIDRIVKAQWDEARRRFAEG